MLDKRRNKILAIINERGYVKTNELADELNASLSTVQRDIIVLEQKGLLKRVWSGAKSNNKLKEDYYVQDETSIEFEGAFRLAKFASEYVGDHDFIFIDDGVITGEMIGFLKNKRITIVTNSINVLNKVKELRLDGILIGGIIDCRTSNFYGSMSLDCLDNFNFTKSFLSAAKVSVDGVFTNSINEVELKQKVIAQSKRAFFVIDKIGFKSNGFWKIAGLSHIEVITNYEFEKEYHLFLKNMIKAL